MNRVSVNVYGRCKCLLFSLARGAGGPPASAGILMSLGWSSCQKKFNLHFHRSVGPPVYSIKALFFVTNSFIGYNVAGCLAVVSSHTVYIFVSS